MLTLDTYFCLDLSQKGRVSCISILQCDGSFTPVIRGLWLSS